MLAKPAHSLYGMVFQTSLLGFVGVLFFLFSFYSLSIWFSHVWGKHWLSARGAAPRGAVGKAPYGAGGTSANLWRCSSASRALGAFPTCAREKWIWHKDFPGALMYEKQNEFARGDCKRIRVLHCAKPTSLMELRCPYLLPFLLNCSVYFPFAVVQRWK